MAVRTVRTVEVYPWWILVVLVALAGGFGVLIGTVGLHVVDPFGDYEQIERMREELLDSAPYMPWFKRKDPQEGGKG